MKYEVTVGVCYTYGCWATLAPQTLKAKSKRRAKKKAKQLARESLAKNDVAHLFIYHLNIL